MSYQKEINIPSVFISSMRLNYNSGSTKLSKYWLDYQFFYDLYQRINFIWKKDNIYRDKYKEAKKNKIQKYEYILENIILDKEKKIYIKKNWNFYVMSRQKKKII